MTNKKMTYVDALASALEFMRENGADAATIDRVADLHRTYEKRATAAKSKPKTPSKASIRNSEQARKLYEEMPESVEAFGSKYVMEHLSHVMTANAVTPIIRKGKEMGLFEDAESKKSGPKMWRKVKAA